MKRTSLMRDGVTLCRESDDYMKENAEVYARNV